MTPTQRKALAEIKQLALYVQNNTSSATTADACVLIAAKSDAALAEPIQEPFAWMFQHDETGRIQCVETQQVEWGFEKANPRLKKIAPLYRSPQPHEWQELCEYEKIDVCNAADKAMGADKNLSWRMALIDQTSAALRAKNGE